MKKVKQILNWMALYKLNRFHWHLTDSQGWRIEIKPPLNSGYALEAADACPGISISGIMWMFRSRA